MKSTQISLSVALILAPALLIGTPVFARQNGNPAPTKPAPSGDKTGGKTDKSGKTASQPTPESIEKMIVAVIDLTNAERAKQHLEPLKRQSQLEQAAKWLAQDMADKEYMSHTDSKKRSIDTRLPEFGYKDYQTIGENIATGQPTAAAVVNSWMNSPGHRANILNPEFREIGVGVAYTRNGNFHWYWAQDFGKQFDR